MNDSRVSPAELIALSRMTTRAGRSGALEPTVVPGVRAAMKLTQLPPTKEMGHVRVVIETPKGARNKLNYDPELEVFCLAKSLPLGMTFPFDFGFIPQTVGEDGDPLDAVVLMPDSLAPGCVIDGRLIGVIRGMQREPKQKPVRNDRFLVVHPTAAEYDELNTPADLSTEWLKQIGQFFATYSQLEGRDFEVLGIDDAEEAHKLILAARGATS